MNENTIAQNIYRIEEKIHTIALRHHRKPEEITLIGVSKFFPAQSAEDAVRAGLMDLGENRVSELVEKREILLSHNLHPDWHLIGTLQRRKVRQVIGKVCLIHSVDSRELLDEISKCSVEAGLQSPILLQVNVSGEATKHGFDPDDMEELMEIIPGLRGVELRGIMTMAPLTPDEKILSMVFSKAQMLFYDMKSKMNEDAFRVLSMGMSNDYPIAIKYGATHLRIGTAIFGARSTIV